MSERVLVVEDNELNLKLFCDLLRAHEYVAEPVRDGREAVARARAVRPDLIIMDIQMPYVSGLDLIEECKADDELKTIPIMAVTAYAGKGDEDRVRAAGAEAYVSKPISLLRFIEEVGALAPRTPEIEDAAQPVAGDETIGAAISVDDVEETAAEADEDAVPVDATVADEAGDGEEPI